MWGKKRGNKTKTKYKKTKEQTEKQKRKHVESYIKMWGITKIKDMWKSSFFRFFKKQKYQNIFLIHNILYLVPQCFFYAF